MRRASVLALSCLTVAAVGCGDGGEATPGSEPRAAVIEATEATLGAGPSAATVSAMTPGGEYEIRGSFDPDPGYRLCGRIRRSPDRLWAGLNVWIGSDGRQYETLVEYRDAPGSAAAAASSCAEAEWLNDHPPTLSLLAGRDERLTEPPYNGVEDYLHAMLAAFTELDGAAEAARADPRCARGACYSVAVDFARFVRGRRGDEDLSTLRPFARSLGAYRLEVRIDQNGLVDRLRLAAPSPSDPDRTPSAVAVAIELSGFGDAPEVEGAQYTALE